MARAFRNGELTDILGAGPGSTRPLSPASRVYVGGYTGSLSALSVVKLGTPLISATDEPLVVQGTPVFTGSTPSAATDPFAILLEPLSSDEGAIARAAVLGATVCYVTVTSSAHAYAVPTSSTTALASAAAGPAKIIWKAGSSGTVLAVVLLIGDMGLWQSTADTTPASGEPRATETLTPSPGSDPTTSPVVQYVVEQDYDNANTPRIRQFQFTDGTTGANGITTTLTPTQYVVGYDLDGATGSITTSSSAGALTIAYVADNLDFTGVDTLDLTGVTVTGLTGVGLAWQLLATIDYTALTTAGVGPEDEAVYTLAAKGSILGLQVVTTTAAVAAGLAALTTTIRIGGTTYGASGDGFVLNDISGRWFPGYAATEKQVFSWTATTAVELRFQSMGANLNTLTAGQWKVYGLIATVA